MEIFFKILAVILAGVAAYFLWQGNGDYAFVAAVAGAVSFFLSVRVEVKKRNAVREALREAEERRSEGAEEYEDEEYDDDEFEDDEQENSDSAAPQLNEAPARTEIEPKIRNPKSQIPNRKGGREI